MAFERRDGSGGAVDTTITADITNVSLSIGITSSTGWPSGGANGPFFVIIDYDVAGKEKVEVASRTGTTLTVANTSKRGIDDTVAAAHLAGAKIRFCFTEQDRDEANYTMAQTVGKVTTKGDMVVATAVNTFARLPVGANNTAHVADSAQATGTKWAALDASYLATTGTPTTILPDDAAAAGASTSVARIDHKHAIAAAPASSVGTANSEGVSTSFARADHNHDLIQPCVDTADITNLAVTAGKIANGAIANGAALLATGQKLYYSQAGDPGAVGADLLWWNTTTRCLLVRNAANTAWEVIGGTGAWQPYTPALINITLGDGLRFGRYIRMGRIIVGNIFFYIGGTTVFGANIGFGLPYNAADMDSFIGYPGTPTAEFYSHGASRGLLTGAGGIYAGVGVAVQGGASKALDRVQFFATAGTAAWGAGVPGAWGAGGRVSIFFEYEVANAEDANYD